MAPTRASTAEWRGTRSGGGGGARRGGGGWARPSPRGTPSACAARPPGRRGAGRCENGGRRRGVRRRRRARASRARAATFFEHQRSARQVLRAARIGRLRRGVHLQRVQRARRRAAAGGRRRCTQQLLRSIEGESCSPRSLHSLAAAAAASSSAAVSPPRSRTTAGGRPPPRRRQRRRRRALRCAAARREGGGARVAAGGHLAVAREVGWSSGATPLTRSRAERLRRRVRQQIVGEVERGDRRRLRRQRVEQLPRLLVADRAAREREPQRSASPDCNEASASAKSLAASALAEVAVEAPPPSAALRAAAAFFFARFLAAADCSPSGAASSPATTVLSAIFAAESEIGSGSLAGSSGSASASSAFFRAAAAFLRAFFLAAADCSAAGAPRVTHRARLSAGDVEVCAARDQVSSDRLFLTAATPASEGDALGRPRRAVAAHTRSAHRAAWCHTSPTEPPLDFRRDVPHICAPHTSRKTLTPLRRRSRGGGRGVRAPRLVGRSSPRREADADPRRTTPQTHHGDPVLLLPQPSEGFRHCVDVPESNSVFIGIRSRSSPCMNCLGINLQKVGRAAARR